MRRWLVAGLVVLAVAGCDDGEVSDLPYESARAARTAGDTEFNAWLAEAKGTRVRWSGVVVEARRVRGDDYVEEAYATLDMDGGTAGSEAADVHIDVPVSQVDSLVPGQPITIVGTIREFERTTEGPLIKLELKTIE